MKSKLFRLACASVLSAAFQGASAVPVALPSIPSLVNQSNSIVIGRVVGQSAVAEDRQAVSVRVERQLMGTRDGSSDLLEYRFSLRAPGAAGPADGERAIFFLRCEAFSACIATSDVRQRVVAAQKTVQKAVQDFGPDRTDALAQVTAELLGVVEGVDEPPSSKRQAVGLLRYCVPAEQSKLVLKRIVTSTDSSSRLAAVAALAWWGDVADIDSIRAEMSDPRREQQNLVREAAWALHVLEPVPASAVVALTPWLKSSDRFVRESAAAALRTIGTKDAGHALARYALDDEDPDVLYYAVSGLIKTVGRGDYPAMDVFEKDRDKYVAEWKAWRRKHLE